MTQNVLQVGPEIWSVVTGALALLIFGLALSVPHRAAVPAGSKGHREASEVEKIEDIRPDGYIDSFAQEIEEAGGGLPPLVKVFLPGVLMWWLIYLLANWPD